MPPEALEEQLAGWSQPRFRVKQVLDWLYTRRVNSFEEMTNLPAALRARLAEHFQIVPSKQIIIKAAGDITEKLLLELEDRSLVETVLIRYPQSGVGSEESRRTICVSSQVGCAYG